MKFFWITLITYLVIMNIAAMSITTIDKRRAIQKQYYHRISERTLLLTAILERLTFDVSHNVGHSP